MKKRLLFMVATLLMSFALAACDGAGKPDMPMEIEVDGYTIVLGKTTVSDLTDMGYSVNLSKVPDIAKEGDDYIPFYLSVDRGAGDQMHLTVLVPWGGSTDISQETQTAVTEGIIRSVEVTVTSVKKVDVFYNAVDLQDITFDFAAEEWGSKENNRDGSNKILYTIEAQDGTISFESTAASGKEFGSLQVSLSLNKFLDMQKNP